MGFMRQLVGCGFLYYGYNEMGFRVLDLLSPVSAAVANSPQEVAVLLAAIFLQGVFAENHWILGRHGGRLAVLAGEDQGGEAAAEAREDRRRRRGAGHVAALISYAHCLT